MHERRCIACECESCDGASLGIGRAHGLQHDFEWRLAFSERLLSDIPSLLGGLVDRPGWPARSCSFAPTH